jgi:uncharacterized membrane protein
MDLRLRIDCIDASEPALLVSLALGMVAGWLLGRVLTRQRSTGTRRAAGTVWRLLVWAIALVGLFLAPILLTHWLYSRTHPDVMICTGLVWPVFLLPPSVPVFLILLRRWRERGWRT